MGGGSSINMKKVHSIPRNQKQTTTLIVYVFWTLIVYVFWTSTMSWKQETYNNTLRNHKTMNTNKKRGAFLPEYVFF